MADVQPIDTSAQRPPFTPDDQTATAATIDPLYAAMIADYTERQMTVPAIAERYGRCKSGVLHILKRHGIAIRGPGKLTAAQREDAARRYGTGESPTAIAKEFGVCLASVQGLARQRGIGPLHETGRPRTYTLNEAAFDGELSEEARYWVGALITDGCVMDRGTRGHTITLNWSGENGHMLERFRAFLGTDAPVRWRDPSPGGKAKEPIASLAVQSRQIAESLARYGVVPRKTKGAKLLGGLENDQHAWRGAVDGDGWITTAWRTYPVVGLCGSPLLMAQFRDWVDRTFGEARAKVSTAPGMFKYRVNGRRAIALMRLLYANDHIALPCKRARALELIAASPDW